MAGQQNNFEGQYISAGEAATRAGFSRNYVTQLCKSGRINGRLIGGAWLVSTTSLATFVAQKGDCQESCV